MVVAEEDVVLEFFGHRLGEVLQSARRRVFMNGGNPNWQIGRWKGKSGVGFGVFSFGCWTRGGIGGTHDLAKAGNDLRAVRRMRWEWAIPCRAGKSLHCPSFDVHSHGPPGGSVPALDWQPRTSLPRLDLETFHAFELNGVGGDEGGVKAPGLGGDEKIERPMDLCSETRSRGGRRGKRRVAIRLREGLSVLSASAFRSHPHNLGLARRGILGP